MTSFQPLLHFEVPIAGGDPLRLALTADEWRNISKPLVFDKKRRDPGPLDRLHRLFSLSEAPPPLLLFGDSCAIRESWNDRDKRKLVEMLRPLVEDLGAVGGLVGAAFNLRVFHHLLLALQKMSHRPRAVVLPINLRQFSPQWSAHPRYGFESELERIHIFLETGLVPPPVDPGRTEEPIEERFVRYWGIPLDYPADCPETPRLVIGDVLRTMLELAGKTGPDRELRLKRVFCLHYMFRLSREHFLLDYLKKCLTLVQDSDLAAVLYLTPINHLAGLKYVGPDFSGFLEANRRQVLETVAPWAGAPGISIQDWSTLFEPTFFHHPDIANEHLTEAGRLTLARLIAEGLRDNWR